MFAHSVSLLLTLLFLLVPAVSAQELLVNPGLDTDLSGWSPFGLDNGGQVIWDPLDVDGNPDSGSALVLNRHDLPLCTGLAQEQLPAEPNTEYVIGVSALIPSGQASSGHVTLQFQYRSQGCTQFLGIIQSIDWIETTDAWTRGEAQVVSPPEADCVEFAVQVCKEIDTGDFSAYFDRPSARVSTIFSDGFETGGVEEWSRSEP